MDAANNEQKTKMTNTKDRTRPSKGVAVRRGKATGDVSVRVPAPNRRPHSEGALELERQLAHAAEAGLGVSALRVMLALGRKPLFMGGAAEAVDSSTASVTGMVDRLESQGFVERRRSSEDRRSIELGLTDRGEAVLLLIVG